MRKLSARHLMIGKRFVTLALVGAIATPAPSIHAQNPPPSAAAKTNETDSKPTTVTMYTTSEDGRPQPIHQMRDQFDSLAADSKNALVDDVHLQLMPGNKEAIESTKPSNIRKWDATRHAVKRFVPETISFTLARTALAIHQLRYDYADNPLGMMDVITTTQDPVGNLGFFMFIVANHKVQSKLMPWTVAKVMKDQTKAPNFKQRFALAAVPQISMTAGMMASNIVHEMAMFVSDKSIQECAKITVAIAKSSVQKSANGDAQLAKMQESQDAVCDAAYETWVQEGHRKAMTYAPTLISMLGSNILSAFIVQGMQGAKTWGQNRIVQAYGIEIAKNQTARYFGARSAAELGIHAMIKHGPDAVLWASPQGWPFKVAGFVGRVANFTMFIALDMWINNMIRQPMMYWYDSGTLKNDTDRIVNLIATKKRIQWKPGDGTDNKFCGENVSVHKNLFTFENCRADLPKEIERLQRGFATWRSTNLEQEMIAYNAWNTIQSDVMTSYNAADQFYRLFVDQMRKRKSGEIDNFSRHEPLTGVRPSVDKISPLVMLSSNPGHHQAFRNLQKQTLEEVAKKWEANLNIAERAQLTPQERVEMLRIVSDLGHEDLKVVEKALRELRLMSRAHENRGALGGSMGSLRMNVVARQITDDLGRLEPIENEGAFVVNVLNGALEVDLKDKNIARFTRARWVVPENLGQKFVLDMICGPNVDHSNELVREVKGLAAVFQPGRLVSASASTGLLCDFNPQRPKFFFFDRAQAAPQEKKPHDNPVLFVVNATDKGRIEGFTDWWNQSVDQKLIDWFESKELEYDRIMARLLNKIRAEKNHGATRANTVDNGVVRITRQELKFYLMLIGEVIKDNTSSGDRAEQIRGLPREFSQRSAEIKKRLTHDRKCSGRGNSICTLTQSDTPQVSWLTAFASDQNYDLGYYLSGLKGFEYHQPVTPVLAVQRDVMAAYEELAALFAKMEVVQDADGKSAASVRSAVRNSDLINAQKNITETIKKHLPVLVAAVKQDQFKADVLASAISAIEASVEELKSYGEMVNLMSIVKNRADTEQAKNQKVCVSGTGSNRALHGAKAQGDCEESGAASTETKNNWRALLMGASGDDHRVNGGRIFSTGN